ncbi:hypothetical protein VCHA43P277_40129 [Vibrio chagasii]|nr:hypothetical protein VCHA35O141_30078 [Vibrio chagasii]CAH6953246.1 hypothetical protein VCHA35O143_30163 [Vibrio chagasii]CAH7004654.1 hypothetical protein VCHA34P126_50131 [Vibrio chagasii]CAH7193653.1 hypothetical protein VCHA48P434_20249 [Vibrio chagasii]CAH7239933.1 hypothetical protein VCHA41O246_30164 [Vibrio chagasii]
MLGTFPIQCKVNLEARASEEIIDNNISEIISLEFITRHLCFSV